MLSTTDARISSHFSDDKTFNQSMEIIVCINGHTEKTKNLLLFDAKLPFGKQSPNMFTKLHWSHYEVLLNGINLPCRNMF